MRMPTFKAADSRSIRRFSHHSDVAPQSQTYTIHVADFTNYIVISYTYFDSAELSLAILLLQRPLDGESRQMTGGTI